MLREQRNDIIHTLYNTDNNSFMKLAYECECCLNMTDEYSGSFYLESGKSGYSVLKKMIDKLKETFERVCEKISEFFNGKKLEKMEKDFKEKPEKANKKVKTIDYDKLMKETDDALKDIERVKNIEDLKKAKEKHDKKMKIIKGTTIIVTAATALDMSTRYFKKIKEKRNNVKSIEDKYKKLESKPYSSKDLVNSASLILNDESKKKFSKIMNEYDTKINGAMNVIGDDTLAFNKLMEESNILWKSAMNVVLKDD